MPVQKGQVLNPNGRGKGTKNKKTVQWENFVKYSLSWGLKKFQKEMAKLEGKDFTDQYLKLLEYFKPKLSRTQGVTSNLNYDISNMPKAYLDRIIAAQSEEEILQIITEYESHKTKSRSKVKA
jgi:hypothetical protein